MLEFNNFLGHCTVVLLYLGLISISQHCLVIFKCCWSHQQHGAGIADHAADSVLWNVNSINKLGD